MRIRLVAATALWLAGCGAGTGQSPSLSLADLPTELTLAVGETRTIGPSTVSFAAVKSDSRCPTDVTCVWAGNAELEFVVGPAVGEGPAFRVLLNTGVDPQQGSARGLQLTVVDLEPAPVSTAPTRDYRVVLRVDRVD